MIALDSTRWRRLDEALRRNVPLVAKSLAPSVSMDACRRGAGRAGARLFARPSRERALAPDRPGWPLSRDRPVQRGGSAGDRPRRANRGLTGPRLPRVRGAPRLDMPAGDRLVIVPRHARRTHRVQGSLRAHRSVRRSPARRGEASTWFPGHASERRCRGRRHHRTIGQANSAAEGRVSSHTAARFMASAVNMPSFTRALMFSRLSAVSRRAAPLACTRRMISADNH